MFCPECDAVLVPLREKDSKSSEKKFQCRDCGYTNADEKIAENYVIKDEITEEERSKIEIIEQQIDSGGVPEEMIEELREQYREALENFEI